MDLLDAAAGPFDLVVCNPPYVSIDESSRLQREVREHEPHVALFAGNDGLDVYRRLIPSVRKTLRRGGYLLLEIGFSLEEPVLNLFGKDWERLPTERDLQEIPRVVCVRLSA
jgi:release factor glutamine methyltransferase